jgi:hypothetical protein
LISKILSCTHLLPLHTKSGDSLEFCIQSVSKTPHFVGTIDLSGSVP